LQLTVVSDSTARPEVAAPDKALYQNVTLCLAVIIQSVQKYSFLLHCQSVMFFTASVMAAPQLQLQPDYYLAHFYDLLVF